jgi:hypothetical protein
MPGKKETMNIRFVQSGGFGGLLRECEIDTRRLPAAEAHHVTGLVRASGIPQTGEYAHVRPEARDLRTYNVAIEGDGYQVQAVYDELSIPPGDRSLLAYLAEHAQPVRRVRQPVYPD